MRIKPVGYFRGFTVTVAAIRSSLAFRVGYGTWLGDLNLNRQKSLASGAESSGDDAFGYLVAEAVGRRV